MKLRNALAALTVCLALAGGTAVAAVTATVANADTPTKSTIWTGVDKRGPGSM